MLRPEMLHPMIVHFPIALIIVALGAFIVYAISKKEFFSRVGAWTITLGALSAAVAVAAGFVAEANAPHNDAAHEILEKFHQPLGLAVLALSVFLVLWGFAMKWRISGGKLIAYIAILFTTVVVLGFIGHYGAMMVYEHGMGVNPEVLRPMVHEHSGGDEHHDSHGDGDEKRMRDQESYDEHHHNDNHTKHHDETAHEEEMHHERTADDAHDNDSSENRINKEKMDAMPDEGTHHDDGYDHHH